MSKLTLADVANLNNQTSAVGTINANSALVETALENTLSRDGTSPNQMEATLDMNSNRIVNLPEATSNTEPVRKAEFDVAIAEGIEVSATVWRDGAGVPSNTLGSENDYYLNTTNGDVYQKSATSGTTYEVVGNIKGATGAAGAAGADGAGGLWDNTRLAKTSAYSVVNGDKGKTIALDGASVYTLTFGAASGYDANFAVYVVNEDTTQNKTVALTGGTNFILYPGQTALVLNQNDVWYRFRSENPSKGFSAYLTSTVSGIPSNTYFLTFFQSLLWNDDSLFDPLTCKWSPPNGARKVRFDGQVLITTGLSTSAGSALVIKCVRNATLVANALTAGADVHTGLAMPSTVVSGSGQVQFSFETTHSDGDTYAFFTYATAGGGGYSMDNNPAHTYVQGRVTEWA